MSTNPEFVKKSPRAEISTFSDFNNDLDAQIIGRVLEGLNQKDKHIVQAFKDFLVIHKEELEKEESRDIVKNIETKESLGAIVKMHQAFIEFMASRNRLKLAQKKFFFAVDNLKTNVEKFEGIDTDLEWGINHHKYLIFKESKEKTEKKEKAFRKIYEFAKSMADGSAPVSLESIRNGGLPRDVIEALSHLPNDISDFLQDLADLLLETGVKGHGEVVRLCGDPNVAKAFAEEEENPAPLRFLAQIILKYIRRKE